MEDEKGGGEHLMRLLGFNQYGIWPEDDWKTNLIWEAIRLSFISLAVSPVDLPGSYCHLFPFNTHQSEFRVPVHNSHLANKQASVACEDLAADVNLWLVQILFLNLHKSILNPEALLRRGPCLRHPGPDFLRLLRPSVDHSAPDTYGVQ